MIYLVGYTGRGHTNWYPWYFLNRLFNELGFQSRHLEGNQIRPKDGDLLICWNCPTCEDFIKQRKPSSGVKFLQKLTSLDGNCNSINWGKDAFEFYKTWTWPQHQRLERLINSNYECYGFGTKTIYEPFPEKKRIFDNYKDKIFEVIWGSHLLTYEEINKTKPILGGFKYDVGYVGSKWGGRGRGNGFEWDNYLSPIFNEFKNIYTAGLGTKNGPIDNNKHKEVLKLSKLCPILHADSWKKEQGLMDRFWTVFSLGRFGVCDNEGAYLFFNKDEVEVEINKEEYINKSIWYVNNVNAQKKYIENVLNRIKTDYNMNKQWTNILNKIYKKK